MSDPIISRLRAAGHFAGPTDRRVMFDARVAIAELVEALEQYADTFCELGRNDECCGRLSSDECSGCLARGYVAKYGDAIAAGTQSAETGETPAPSEGCQSVPKGSPK